MSSFKVIADPERLRGFAAAIGETRQLYLDAAAARQAGHRGLPLPPTFLFGLCLEAGEAFAWFREVGFDLPRVLHAEQSFVYHRHACADEVLTVSALTTERFVRREGALRFAVRETRIDDASGRPVAELRGVFVQPAESIAEKSSAAETGPVIADADALRLPPIDRFTLARFGNASGDSNPLHLDPVFARAAGFDDVIAQGMLSMAYLGRWLTERVPQAHLRRFGARFLGVTRVGEAPVCTGRLSSGAVGDTRRADLRVTSQHGHARLVGEALIAAPERPTPESSRSARQGLQHA